MGKLIQFRRCRSFPERTQPKVAVKVQQPGHSLRPDTSGDLFERTKICTNMRVTAGVSCPDVPPPGCFPTFDYSRLDDFTPEQREFLGVDDPE